MLTGKMVRVRKDRGDRVPPYYLDTEKETWLEVAEALLEIFRDTEGRTRGEIEEEIEETFGRDPGQLVHQGLIKLLEDRCEFEVASDHPPEQLREAAFRAAALARTAVGEASGLPHPGKPESSPTFDRALVLKQTAESLGLTQEQVEAGLFADLRSEQRLIRFRDLAPRHLLERYNVGLAQAILLRSTRVHLAVRGESPKRYRQLLRQMKFHRLICEIKKTGP